LTNLQGFNIYMGSSATNLARVANVAANQTNYNKTALAAGTYYFAVSAYSTSGSESALSNVANKTIQ
jgi:hypothetical protein